MYRIAKVLIQPIYYNTIQIPNLLAFKITGQPKYVTHYERITPLMQCLLSGVCRSECNFPTAEVGVIHGTVVGEAKENYAQDDFVLIKCPKHISRHFGIVRLDCVNGTVWSAPDRQCTGEELLMSTRSEGRGRGVCWD